MRLGVYADLEYVVDEGVVMTDVAFVQWIAALGSHLEELVVLGRLRSEPGRAPHRLQGDNVRFVSLPHYASLRDGGAVLRSISRSCETFATTLTTLDAALVFGPHPLGLLLARTAGRCGVPVVIGARQDFPEYIRNRMAGWASWPAHLLEVAHTRAGAPVGAIVVGEAVSRRYAAVVPKVLSTPISLVKATDVVGTEVALGRRWPKDRIALSVGRLDPEKNPLLLLDVLDRLRSRQSWTLVVAGTGSLEDQFDAAAHARGLDAYVTRLGDVDSATVRSLYERATVFVHVSLTEGVPQVLLEAAAAGTPIVATAVGGVREALAYGARGSLVPPRDAPAIVRAVEALDSDRVLRRSKVMAGLEWARRETMEQQTARVVRFIEGLVSERAAVEQQ